MAAKTNGAAYPVTDHEYDVVEQTYYRRERKECNDQRGQQANDLDDPPLRRLRSTGAEDVPRLGETLGLAGKRQRAEDEQNRRRSLESCSHRQVADRLHCHHVLLWMAHDVLDP